MTFTEYIQIISIFGPVSLLMAITPGPDFIIVSQKTIESGKSSGLKTTLGMATGLLSHAVISASLTNFLNQKLENALKYIQIFGIFFLFYIGISSLYKSFQNKSLDINEKKFYQTDFMAGFIINLFNPKIIFFYLSLVPQFLNKNQINFFNIIFLCSIHILASVLCIGGLSLFLEFINNKLNNPKTTLILQRTTAVTMLIMAIGFLIRTVSSQY